MARRYTWRRPNGEKATGGIAHAMAAAGRRIVLGAGPFAVRRGEYKHPNLGRGRTVFVVHGILKKVGVGVDVVVRNGHDTQVFAVQRIAPEPTYRNPFRDAAGVYGLRQDQGVDYGVNADSPVYAIGPGRVTVYRTSSGWPWDATHADGGGYIAYEITAGPAKGLFVYFAEHITLNPALKVGSPVDSGTRLATQHAGFANCEMGWAGSNSFYGYGPGDAPEAVECYAEGDRTRAGNNFDLLMRALGAPAGLTEGRALKCTLPTKYPRRWKDKV